MPSRIGTNLLESPSWLDEGCHPEAINKHCGSKLFRSSQGEPSSSRARICTPVFSSARKVNLAMGTKSEFC